MKTKKIAFRVDSSNSIGSGHVHRCLALAHFFKKNAADVYFFGRNHKGNIHSFIRESGFQLIELTQPSREWVGEKTPHADWLGTDLISDVQETNDLMEKVGKFDALFMDHYAIDDRWLKPFLNRNLITAAIDDLCDRSLNFDLLINQSIGVTEKNYTQLSPNSQKLLGPKYALLRNEFNDQRSDIKTRNRIQNILISFGGIDATNETQKTVLALLPELEPEMKLQVVPGTMSKIDTQSPQIVLHKNTQKMASLMKSADLAFGAPGTMTWERCAMGLPAIVTILADNQLRNAQDGENAGFQICLGTSNEVTVKTIKEAFLMLKKDRNKLQSMSQKAQDTVDTLGTKRVYDALMEKM